jgi:hypothetical protein
VTEEDASVGDALRLGGGDEVLSQGRDDVRPQESHVHSDLRGGEADRRQDHVPEVRDGRDLLSRGGYRDEAPFDGHPDRKEKGEHVARQSEEAEGHCVRRAVELRPGPVRGENAERDRDRERQDLRVEEKHQ